MVNGPLIPGMREFDTPKRGVPAWLPWLIGSVVVVAALVIIAGFVGGVGPLRTLGLTTSSLQAISYRPTPDERVIQVAIAMPPEGLCRDDKVTVTPFERGNRIEIASEVTRPRQTDCPVSSIGGDATWVDVALKDPLGERTVIRLPDRQPLTRDSGAVGG